MAEIVVDDLESRMVVQQRQQLFAQVHQAQGAARGQVQTPEELLAPRLCRVVQLYGQHGRGIRTVGAYRRVQPRFIRSEFVRQQRQEGAAGVAVERPPAIQDS